MLSRNVFRLCAGLALFSSAQAQAAQAQSCLNRNEVRGMVAYMLPIFGSALIERCKTRLPSDSYLVTRGPKLVSALQAGQEAAWPAARSAFIKISGDGDEDTIDAMNALPESTMRPLIEGMVDEEFIGDVKTRDCKDADRIMKTMEPLPAANVVDLVTELVMIGGRGDKEVNVCKES